MSTVLSSVDMWHIDSRYIKEALCTWLRGFYTIRFWAFKRPAKHETFRRKLIWLTSTRWLFSNLLQIPCMEVWVECGLTRPLESWDTAKSSSQRPNLFVVPVTRASLSFYTWFSTELWNSKREFHFPFIVILTDRNIKITHNSVLVLTWDSPLQNWILDLVDCPSEKFLSIKK